MSSCLPISTTSRILVGSESRSTMLAASLAAVVPEFMARPTLAWARAGASLVPSPVMATIFPSACSFLMTRILSSGLHSAIKPSTPASFAMVAAVRGIVAGAHDGFDADGAQTLKTLCHAGLDGVFQVNNAQNLVVLAHDQGRAAQRRNFLYMGAQVSRDFSALRRNILLDGVRSALADPGCRRAGPRRSCGSGR